MNELPNDWMAWFASHDTQVWVRVVLVALFGLIAGRLASGALGRVIEGQLQHGLLLRRMLTWGIWGLTFALVLQELGLNVSVVLGAAGVLSVALGFASQTSASNLISGLFLLGERPFVPGNVIQVGTTVGEVVSVDLLSVKLRTFDNLLVRIPNEMLLKVEITNLSHFPIRRMDQLLLLDADADLGQLEALVRTAAEDMPEVLDEPAPTVMMMGQREIGLEARVSVWAAQGDWGLVRSKFPQRLRKVLREAGIRAPVGRIEMGAGLPPSASK